jgi:hypothetical protein
VASTWRGFGGHRAPRARRAAPRRPKATRRRPRMCRDDQGRTGPAEATASQPVVGTGVKGIPPFESNGAPRRALAAANLQRLDRIDKATRTNRRGRERAGSRRRPLEQFALDLERRSASRGRREEA